MSTKRFVYPLVVKKYTARHRWAYTVSGEYVNVLTTRYMVGIKLRAAVGPRGGKAYTQHVKPAYYDASTGLWYEMVKTATPDEFTEHMTPEELKTRHYASLKPITFAVLHDAHVGEDGAPYPMELEIHNGRCVAVHDSYGDYDVTDPAIWYAAADELGLNKPARKSPRKCN